MLRVVGIVILVVIAIAAGVACLLLILSHGPSWGYLLVTAPMWVPGTLWYIIARLGFPLFLKCAIEGTLISVVAFTCLALGGTPAWTWVVVEAMVALAVLLWGVRMIVERRVAYVKTPLNVLALLLLFYIFFQLIPLPVGILRVLQPNAVRVRTVGIPAVPGVASQDPDGGGRYAVSLNRSRTRGQLFLYMAYAGFFFVFINNVTTRQQVGRMVGVVIGVGAIVAIAGFSTLNQEDRFLYRLWPVGGKDEKPYFLKADTNPEFSAGYGFVFDVHEGDEVDFYVPKVHGGDVFGGFPSSNSGATVLLMTLLVSLSVFFGYVSTHRSQWGSGGGLLYTQEGNITLLTFFISALLVYALVMTRSRGGIVVMIGLVPALILLVAFSRSLAAGITAAVVIAVVLIVPMALAGTTTTVGFLGEQAGAWLNPWQENIQFYGRESARRIAADFPLFGTGLGTFSSVYPAYKTYGPMLYFAHCDPLQWVSEMGLGGTLLAGAMLLVGAATVVNGWFRLKDPFFRRLLLGSSLGCVACVAHGLVDFPLSIPGVTIVFVALAAISVVAALDRTARHEESEFIF